ncbi:hypothetical protein [Cohnella sp.]|uniref:hypothetical protein n=1 Tax=Cohnella sp. TaxID=1883426 RepID=UPI003569F30C
MRRMYPLLSAAFLALILAGCSVNTNNGGVTVSDIQNVEPPTASPAESPKDTQPSEPSPDQHDSLVDIGQEVVELLRERDLKSLAQWIDPELGLRFSPYSYINKDSDLIFKPEELPAFKDTTQLMWGSFDGSGDPIKLTFRDYYDKFVYNRDFADAPNVSANKILGLGNAEYNGTEVYPNSSYVEFHFPGTDKKYEGMDWQSLVLVFVPHGDDWKLVAVVHGQWTI